jgi:hypothetical protein
MDSLDEHFKSLIQYQLTLQIEAMELFSKKNKNNSQIFKQIETVLSKLIESVNKTIENEYSIFMFRSNQVKIE